MNLPLQKMGKQEPKERDKCPSACVACGSAASGYNYDAPSCLPCKTFFRRKVLQEEVFRTCFKNGVCSKDKRIRPCRSCRLDRCISGGMNPLLIGSLQNAYSNPIVLRFLRARAVDGTEPSTSSPCADTTQLSVIPIQDRNPAVLECTIDKIIGGLIRLESVQKQLRISPKFGPQNDDGNRLHTMIACGSIFSVTVMNAYTKETALKRIQRHGLPEQPEVKKDWSLVDLFITIEYMKTFEFFKYLSIEDKKALIRHVTIMCADLTLAFTSYVNNNDVAFTPDSTTLSQGCFAGDLELMRREMHDVIRILRDLNIDQNEYVLLKALIICNPAIEHLSTTYKKELERERLKYSKSLMSYVLHIRGHDKGPETFTSMMAFVGTLTLLMKRQKNRYVLSQALDYRSDSTLRQCLKNDIYED
ncbi:hypothetical protein PENTCL1PPCAC_16436 [Pristionchus entomophagus]|uniref:Nuclear receptor n=1 Tax=Pristionchus entomophagus TaxID=358040 RepID=A0AAV5TIW4_9BILA|nr:hypothetical protein PENTCL1PPCAC_16436 [Pristionchus entomophagus]